MEIKRKIRKEMRNMRNGISNDEVLDMSMCICKKLSKLKPEAEYENILLYSAINNETDLTEYYRYLKENNKKIFFPKVSGDTMEFYQVTWYEEMKKGSFSIMEPVADENKRLKEDDRALMIVPGVAFSTDRYRIGYGKGYYDKYLSCHLAIDTIGVCYDFQLTNEKINDKHDVRLGGIITEKREVFGND